ncbi:MAG: response regulator [Candidatus Cloacimonetes bacterium]|nr:response regulator [Candidatus Cloacimonadota bacterium]
MVKRILVVDDDLSVLEFLEKDLKKLLPEMDIVTTDSGYSALKQIMTGSIDLLITDIAMPDMDGYELFLRAREQNEEMPVIMMTGFGYDPNHTIVNARNAGLGAEDVLFKPFDAGYLVKLILERLNIE